MYRFDVNIPSELQKQLDNLINIDDVAPKMLIEASPIYVKAIKANINRVIRHKDTSTGSLVKSVKIKKPKKAKTGAWIANVTFDGKDDKGTRNGLKAMELQYGNSHQQATPFLESANKDSEKEVAEVMQEVYSREVND